MRVTGGFLQIASQIDSARRVKRKILHLIFVVAKIHKTLTFILTTNISGVITLPLESFHICNPALMNLL